MLKYNYLASICFILFISVQMVTAQTIIFPFQNPDLPIEERVDDLINRLTLEEKIAQMQDVAPAIDRLGIHEYNWWNECLHGVARAGNATAFPQAIGMAATWNPKLINEVADLISTEARAKFNVSCRKGRRDRYMGLTMWTPNINIFRDPRWGRGQETYGEDPYLTGRLGVAFVQGLQGNDADYFKVIATPKHFAVHSGPEYNRHSFDAYTSKKDLWETYLPAFEATVIEGQAYSIMSAYNRYLGESATASPLLLNDILRDKWGFKGYVVSDCGAVYDIYKFHKIVNTAEEAAALAVKAGCDLNCGNTYSSLLTAVEKGLITDAEIDGALKRLIEAKLRLGLFNPIDQMPFDDLGEKDIESELGTELACKTARESVVLLNNKKKILPLSKDIKSIAVIGPTANDRHVLLGNYFGVPSQRTTVLNAIKDKVSPNTKVNYFKGVNIIDDKAIKDVVPASFFKNNLKVEYYNNAKFEGVPVLTREENAIDSEWGGAAPISDLSPGDFSIRYSGMLNKDNCDLLSLSVEETGGAYTLKLNGEIVLSGNSGDQIKNESVHLKFDKEDYDFELEYKCTNPWMASVQLMYHDDNLDVESTLENIIEESEVVVYVGGISARLEGEEMPVDVDGFHKGDRTHLKLPAVQQALLKKIHALGKPVIMVLNTGSAIALNWEDENLDAIVLAWYPGQAGGDAVANVLFGDYNPSGKLPVTFYKSVNDLPDFEDYSMQGRTYRYFKGDALYPFGYGLSYTEFAISKPLIEKDIVNRDQQVKASVKVKNVGKYDGATVLQVYISKVNASSDQPIKSLRKFKKVSLKKGELLTVEFLLSPDDFAHVNDNGEKVIDRGKYEIAIGEHSSTENKVQIELR